MVNLVLLFQRRLSHKGHFCHLDNDLRYEHYVQYQLRAVLVNSGTPWSFAGNVCHECGQGVQSGVAGMLNVSLASVVILSDPVLNTQGSTGILDVVLRLQQDSVATEAGIPVLFEDALSNNTALGLHLTQGLRGMAGALAAVDVRDVTVVTTKHQQQRQG
eukprot:CAMPEP_0180500706 /NCGR_PEP_ID=MMETSP1036_2-20121128/44511_1 /TAXON_ID=632150 /ORGANISM="Azadinium spinosum, Strain 3D9" /LENGTH=159 /DNA_ID=CAMNT_0022509423 /DNA_START=168 /DNA_END=644 /DNA_ORIENTATION=+